MYEVDNEGPFLGTGPGDMFVRIVLYHMDSVRSPMIIRMVVQTRTAWERISGTIGMGHGQRVAGGQAWTESACQ